MYKKYFDVVKKEQQQAQKAKQAAASKSTR